MLNKRIPALILTGALLLCAGAASADYAAKVIDLVNKERTARGLHPLVYNEKLATAAQKHSQDMAAHDYFSHTSRDGRNFNDRIAAAGYDYRVSGENIAAGQPTPAAVVDKWMKSAPHRENILNPDFCDIGVGYAAAPDSKFQHFWTQDFGRRAGVSRCDKPAAGDAVKKSP